MAETELELINVLNQQDKILDEMLLEQKNVQSCVLSRKWEGLQESIEKIDSLGNEFVMIDTNREVLYNGNKEIWTNPSVTRLLQRVRSKLIKSKLENENLNKYVGASRRFINGVIDEFVPSHRANVYNRSGMVKKGGSSGFVFNSMV